MKVCGVVVLYNPSHEVALNIKTYLPKLDKLYVVDNSVHQDNHGILPQSKKIEYINNHQNLGIAKALNIACEKGCNDGYTWILTMDQDSKFEKNNLDLLLQYVENNDCKNVGIVTPYHVIETNIPRPTEEIDYPIEVMTSGNLLNLKAYKEVSGFKEWLFIDCVDIDMCMNLRVHGYDIVRINRSELNHHLGDSTVHYVLGHRVVCTNHNSIRRYYIARNCCYIYKMYYKYFPEHCKFVRGGIKYQARNILCLEKDKFRKLRNIYRGIRDYKKGITGCYPYKN